MEEIPHYKSKNVQSEDKILNKKITQYFYEHIMINHINATWDIFQIVPGNLQF